MQRRDDPENYEGLPNHSFEECPPDGYRHFLRHSPDFRAVGRVIFRLIEARRNEIQS